MQSSRPRGGVAMSNELFYGCPGCCELAPVFPVSRVSGGHDSRCVTAYLCAECFTEIFDGGHRAASRVWSRVLKRITTNHAIFIFFDRPRSEAITHGDTRMSKMIPDAVMEFWKKRLEGFAPEVFGAEVFARNSARRIVNSDSRLTMSRNSLRVARRKLEDAMSAVAPLAAAATQLESKAKAAADKLQAYQSGRGDEIIRAAMSGGHVPPSRDTALAIEAAEIKEAAQLACERRDAASRDVAAYRESLKGAVNEAMNVLIDIDAAKIGWMEDQIKALKRSAHRLGYAISVPGSNPFRDHEGGQADVDRVRRDAPEVLEAYELLN